jgi:hypothetical protein
MWNKTFIATTVVFAAILGFVCLYAFSWLQSITAPIDALAGYNDLSALIWPVLWISTLVLLVIANVILAKSGSPWALWATFVFFAFFVLIRQFLLSIASLNFQRIHGFESGSVIVAPLLGILLIVGFGGVVYANHLIYMRMSRRLYPPKPGEDIGEPDKEIGPNTVA